MDPLAATLSPRLAPLATLGKPKRWNVDDAAVEYGGLTTEDVPELVELARLWADLGHFERTAGTPAMWVPYHACLALAALRAEIVVPTVLGMLDAFEEQEDQWYLELLPRLCARIGSPAIDALERFLGDPEHAEYPRVSVAEGLKGIAVAEAQARDRVVEILVSVLARHEELPVLNATLVGCLADLRATEHAETIEHAFGVGLVDEMVCGSWPEIAFELGVGPQPPRRRPLWETLSRPVAAPPVTVPSATTTRSKKADKRAHKRQRQARKQNRRK